MAVLKVIKHILTYGLTLVVLVLLLKLLQWKFLFVDNVIDIYIGLIAIFCIVLSICVARHLIKSNVKTIIIEKVITEKLEIIEAELQRLNLSSPEYEVLQLFAKEYSNTDNSERLFPSVSTIKTHVSNLFCKMDIKNRTQATEKAKRLNIIL